MRLAGTLLKPLLNGYASFYGLTFPIVPFELRSVQ